MNLLNREELLKKEALKIEKVDLGNDEYVYVRQMTGRERDLFENSLVVEIKNRKGIVERYESNTKDFRAKLCVCTICDEEGVLILKPNDYEMLSTNMSAARLEAIVNKAQELNAISEKDKENLVKNSDADPAGNSTSDSAEN